MNHSTSKIIATLFAEKRVFRVGELNETIKELLETEFFALQVQGEISNCKRPGSGHWYFTLKDADSQLRAVFFRQWNRLLRFEPENGLEVRVRGRLSVYEPRGEYQIVVETMEPVGVGTLQLAFEQQLNRLAAAGLFDELRKRPMPLFPRRIGIVTSPMGAALHDMLQVLARRNPAIDVIIAPVRVQGNGAAGEIADAIRMLNKYANRIAGGIDVIIVGRGGGTIEDLWAFNEEQVARSIYSSKIPVVSAVGHETDFTISDFVADLRAPTPSVAAEMVAADSAFLSDRVLGLQGKLKRTMTTYLLCQYAKLQVLLESQGFSAIAQAIFAFSRRFHDLELQTTSSLKENLYRSRWRLIHAMQRIQATDFRASIKVSSTQMDSLISRLERPIQKRIEQGTHRLAVATTKLNALSPLAVLGRGYSLVKDETGKLVTRASALMPEQKLKIRFEDGEVNCVVIEVLC